MKHSLKITLLLALIFIIAQVVGLAVTNEYIDHKTTAETGDVVFEALPYNLERPQVDESTSYVWIIGAIIIGTLLLLLLIKYRKMNLWKLWFFLAVFFTMAIAFAAFMNQIAAVVLALILAITKIYKPMTILQNLSEVFIYGGLAAIFVPVINIFAAFMLLLLISIYDIIAVRHTKHMVKLAKFQTKSKVFAGLLIPYSWKKGKIESVPANKKSEGKKSTSAIAVLGGGDIGFPLIFAGVVMKGLMLENTELIGFLKTLIIPLFTSIALLYLLLKGKKDKFYPAMPYLTVGCVIGYLAVLLVF
ncbi:MAG: presenilin family intramembrane aspartyl protease [Candidatus Woesearchaeota archaeon]|jgi:presenilin-like A22 family membrane protease|nr:presenilin family intramembrane aspartyl protease [Candidatus Woesearchaeota archaeon]MDP7623229.1 presenilin family intramembrane aspartyl protease [Candidatus Woesearchaeota archaeon]HJN56995.1 presenilin family intramembrane aspartyl protease [Candidatus Woesearchaeota archaeon]|tara:strand:+ start:6776 stop:7684 length:909 start_codon:yes stop_codon:yes gene_type:complete